MKKKILYILWAVLYAVCVGLSFVKTPTRGETVILTLISLGYFVPPFWLFFLAKKERNRKAIKALRLVSGSVLALSMIFIILNILSVVAFTGLGKFLHVLLIVFSTPMVCAQIWAWPLFVWACLLILTLQNRM